MKLKTLLLIQAIAFAVSGLALLFAPQQFMATYGAGLDAAGVGLARLYGATILMGAVIFWLVGSADSSAAHRPLAIGALFGNGLGALVGIFNVTSGAFNAIGWVSVVIWLVFALAFAYFVFFQPKAA